MPSQKYTDLQNSFHTKSWLESLLENVTDGIVIFSSDLTIHFFNSPGLEIINKTKEDIIGISILEILNVVNEIHQPILKNILDKMSVTSQPYQGIGLLLNEAGEELLIQLKISFSKTPDGEKEFSIVFKNITEDRKKSEQWAENEKRYKKLFENVLEGIFIMDEDSNVIDANPAACTIYGIKKDELLKLKVKHLFPHQPEEESDAIWIDFLQKGYIEGYYKYILANGEEKFIDFKARTSFLPGYHLVVFSDVTERRRIADNLKLSEANLKAIFNNSSQLIVLLDQRYKIVTANDQALRWCKEYKGMELLPGNDILDFCDEDYKNKFFNILENARKGVQVYHEVNPKFIHENFWFEFRALPVLGNNDKLIGISLTLTDVSHRKTAELEKDSTAADLAFSEKRFRSLAENSPDIIYIIDLLKREVTYFNRKNIFGYSNKGLQTSEGWIEIVHPDDIKRVKSHWSKFLKMETGTASIEYRLKKNEDDEYEWVVNRHTVIERDGEGRPVFVLLNITIITERKNAEEALKESEARLTSLIENTNDLIWSIDKDFKFTAMNSAFRNLFKNNFRKVIEVGDHVMDSLPTKINIEWLQYHKRALAGERFSSEFNVTNKLKNPSYDVSYNPVYGNDGNITGVSVFARDITLRKSAENDIIRTNFELDSFVYRASHDLRAPLRSVLGLINIVKTEENIHQRNLYLSLADKSINKLDTFIADLTNFSRNSRMEIKMEKINFQNIIAECIENLKYMENADIIDIRTEFDDTAEFYCDAGRISIVLQNLLSNSIKYRNSKVGKSYVFIKVNIQKNFCEIRLEDNGKGIKEEYLDKIFNMFFRASHDSYGSGLGLYITKQVVEKLKGTISVSSTLGEGCVFTIRLPNQLKDLNLGT